jgi:NADH dehydrogenase FAD-containing subunit
MGKRLVLVGGGHAHLTCLKKISNFVARGHDVTLVGPSPHHYYSGMGPGMLGGTYRPQEIRFNIQKMAEAGGARFRPGYVAAIDPVAKRLRLTDGGEVGYDVVSFNTGSGIPLDEVKIADTARVFTVKPIEQLLAAQAFIQERLLRQRLQVVVVGGGPAGLEITGNVWRLGARLGGRMAVTLVAGRRLMGGFPEKVRSLARRSLTARGVEIIEGVHLREVQGSLAVLRDGQMLPFDLIFLALGVRPAKLFRDAGLPTGPDGGLLVNEYLQAVQFPEIFGGGDCIYFHPRPLDKVGVYAVRENPILYHNLLAALEGRALRRFRPGGGYLLIFNLGNDRGIFWKKQVVFDGKVAFWLKDFIDRRFMRQFQIFGELREA